MGGCSRYTCDGLKCTNSTEYGDGWCREAGCDGFVHAEPRIGRPRSGSVGALTLREPRTTITQAEVVATDTDGVWIADAALADFAAHHGGLARHAEVQLRSMLEDFLLDSARSRTASGHVTLRRKGFALVLSPGCHTLVGYRSAHLERTWEQVKVGVRSRGAGDKSRSAGHKPRGPFKNRWRRPGAVGEPMGPIEHGPAIPLSGFRGAVDPASIRLSTRVRRAYAQLSGLTEWSESAVQSLRDEFGRLADAVIGQREDGFFEVASLGRVWLVSPDARTLIGVRWDDPSRPLRGEPVPLVVEPVAAHALAGLPG